MDTPNRVHVELPFLLYIVSYKYYQLDSDEYVGKAEFNSIEPRHANVAVSCQEERAQVLESVGVRSQKSWSRPKVMARGQAMSFPSFEIRVLASFVLIKLWSHKAMIH